MKSCCPVSPYSLLFLLIGLVSLETIAAQPTSSQPRIRDTTSLNVGWQYLESTTTSPTQLPRDQGAWQQVDLPHTWNQWDAVDPVPGYRRSASWYQRPLALLPQPGKRHLLYFEGANISTEVYVNGTRAGGHVGGYVGFDVDITDLLSDTGDNTLSVRVDNGYNPAVIPSQKADFFIYGGITRDLWLVTVPAQRISNSYVRTRSLNEQRASLTAVANLHSQTGKSLSSPRLSAKLVSPQGRVVAQTEERNLSFGESLSLDLPDFTQPQLWSPNTPALYTLVTELYDGQQLVDRAEAPVGLRWFAFEDHGAFKLNGKRLLLRGTHRHEEHAGLGAAMPDSLHRRDIEQMKEMGVNFLRLGHYPQDPTVYRACDELGIIVWDELPWCRGGMGGVEWQANTKRLLREQITQNRAHPSVLFWSLGNEIYWLPDYEGGDDPARMNAFLSELNTIAHEMDPSRMTAIRKYYAGSDLVDVFSPSIWSGWYAGVYTNYEPTLDKNQAKYKRFLHMEYGGSSHVGRHTEEPIRSVGGQDQDSWAEVSNQANISNMAKDGDWTESYIVDLFDWHLSVSEQRETFAGNAQWAFKDFGTPLRPENAIPYINQKGLVDRAGKPKDAFYVYKSYWSDDPFAYIESPTWTERNGPAGVAREVAVYSNCDELELLHNGVSLGKRSRQLGKLPAQGLSWDVAFAEGKNRLEARGPDGVRNELTVNYSYSLPGKVERLTLAQVPLPNGNFLLVATAVDKEGRRVLDYEKPVYFDHNGAGKLLVNYGTPTRSQVIEMANGRAMIELQPAAGECVVELRNQDFKGTYLRINMDQNTSPRR